MSDASYDCRVDGSVIVCDLTEFARADVGDVQDFLETLSELCERPTTRSAVIRLPDRGSISGEVFDLIEQYNAVFEGMDIERIALVSTDVKNLAIKSRIDITDFEVDTIDDLDEAMEWAREPVTGEP